LIVIIGVALIVIIALAINAPGRSDLGYRISLQWHIANLPQARPLTAADRVLVIAPHPDDELLACSETILAARRVGARVDVVWLTSGDGFEWDEAIVAHDPRPSPKDMLALGQQRMGEAREATALLGLKPDQQHFLGFPDGGLLRLFFKYRAKPYTSHLTRVAAVPYVEAVKRGTPYTGDQLLRQLDALLIELKPTLALMPAQEDRHRDHKAAYLFMAQALADCDMEKAARLYIVHGGVEWPMPKGLHRELPLAPAPRGKQLPWEVVPLSPADEQLKLDALHCYRSQTETLGHFLRAFVRTNELISPMPETDLGSAEQ
jgi:LmbE family N-acetylglucosaminyl deacetylase